MYTFRKIYHVNRDIYGLRKPEIENNGDAMPQSSVTCDEFSKKKATNIDQNEIKSSFAV